MFRPRRPSRSKKPKAAKPGIQILTLKSSQLSRGSIKVKVKANKGAKVWLSASTSSFDVPKLTLFKGRTVKLGKKRSRVVTIKLTPAAKTAVAGCEARKLIVTAQERQAQDRQRTRR